MYNDAWTDLRVAYIRVRCHWQQSKLNRLNMHLNTKQTSKNIKIKVIPRFAWG